MPCFLSAFRGGLVWIGALVSVFVMFETSARSEPDSILWDNWYTVTIGKDVHYQYYNEKLTLKKEIQGAKLYIQTQVWKNEEGYINEEHLGAFAENSPSLSPLFYNFYSTYRQSETKIDGTVKSNFLTVVAKRGDQSLPSVKKGLKNGVIFSVFFPVWIGRRLTNGVLGFKPGKSQVFESILEDNIDAAFAPIKGTIRLEKDDPFAIQTKSKKMTVDFKGVRSFWWVDALGAVVKIDNPSQQAVILRVPRDQAQTFLELSPLPSKLPSKDRKKR